MKAESGRAPIQSGMGSFSVMKAESDRAPIKSGMGTFEVKKGSSMTPLRFNKFVVSTSVMS